MEKGKIVFENGSEWFIKKPKSVEGSVKAGERALMGAVSEGMSKKDKKDFVNWLTEQDQM